MRAVWCTTKLIGYLGRIYLPIQSFRRSKAKRKSGKKKVKKKFKKYSRKDKFKKSTQRKYKLRIATLRSPQTPTHMPGNKSYTGKALQTRTFASFKVVPMIGYARTTGLRILCLVSILSNHFFDFLTFWLFDVLTFWLFDFSTSRLYDHINYFSLITLHFS